MVTVLFQQISAHGRSSSNVNGGPELDRCMSPEGSAPSEGYFCEGSHPGERGGHCRPTRAELSSCTGTWSCRGSSPSGLLMKLFQFQSADLSFLYFPFVAICSQFLDAGSPFSPLVNRSVCFYAVCNVLWIHCKK